MLPCAPGVQMQTIPEDAIDVDMEEDEDKQNGEEPRISIRSSEKRIANENELSDSEDEGDNRKNTQSHKKVKKTKAAEGASGDNKSAATDKIKDAGDSNGVEKASTDASISASVPMDATSAEGEKK